VEEEVEDLIPSPLLAEAVVSEAVAQVQQARVLFITQPQILEVVAVEAEFLA
jgi:hypothetical protein